MSRAEPMDLRKEPLEYVGISFYGGRLDAYECQSGHTRLTHKQNRRYWKKQRRLLGKLYPQWIRELEWAASSGKRRPTPRQRKPRRDG